MYCGSGTSKRQAAKCPGCYVLTFSLYRIYLLFRVVILGVSHGGDLKVSILGCDAVYSSIKCTKFCGEVTKGIPDAFNSLNDISSIMKCHRVPRCSIIHKTGIS
jgi:hypothetical protein